MLDERALATCVAFVHRADLRHGHMRLVDDEQEVVGEEVEQGVRRRAGRTAVEMARIILHARADAHLREHLQIVRGAHAQALRLELLALFAQFGHALVEFLLDRVERAFHALRARHIMRGREDVHFALLPDHIAGQGMQGGNAVNFVTKELDADRELLVHRDDLHRIAAHAECATGEGDVVAFVLHVDELAQQRVAIDLLAFLEEQHAARVFLRRAESIDARDRGDHHAVAPREQIRRGGVAQALHVVVDVGVLLDVGVGLRNVRFGLVVVVVREK